MSVPEPLKSPPVQSKAFVTVTPPVPWIVPAERLKFATEMSVSTSRNRIPH